MSPVVEIEIEEVVLHGFRDCNPGAFREALIAGLTRQITLNRWTGSGIQSRRVERIDGGEFHLMAGDSHEITASHIAGALYQSLVSIHSNEIK